MIKGWKVYLSVLLLLFVAACSTDGEEDIDASLAPQVVKGEYIVVLDPSFAPGKAAANRAEAASFARGLGLEPDYAYGAALFGFAAEIPEGRLAALRKNPRVAYVEPVLKVHTFEQSVPTGIRRIFADTNTNLTINGTDDFRVDVDVAVIDTGVDFQHPDLNVVGGVDCTLRNGGPLFGTFYCSSDEGTGGDDDHYHGTHVAGTIGALDNGVGVVGVAPGARLWAVKVLDSSGSGYTSGIVAGIDWVTDNASTIEVANMSLGGSGTSQAQDDAIANAVGAGIVVVVAAGNSADEAANYTPANSPEAFTVSALADFDGQPGAEGSSTCRTDQDDTLADFSNFDTTDPNDADEVVVINIAAPGVCILSTYPLEQGEYGTISGTSMASPHVAGAAALLASGSDNKPTSKADVDAIKSKLSSSGNSNWTDESGDGHQEPLLDVTTFDAQADSSGDTGDGTEPEPTTIDLSANGYKVKGSQRVDLNWSGATSINVDIYRDGGSPIATANDGAYTDAIDTKGGGSYTYKVCEADTSTCSNEVQVVF